MTINVDDLDAETKALMRAYAGAGFDKPHEITIKVFCEYASEEWSLDEFQNRIEIAVAAIPTDKRSVAKVGLEGGYDGLSKLVIFYRGMESETAVQERIARCLDYARKTQAGERTAYERLKRKFE